MSKNKKKLGYSQYEDLLLKAHQKIELLAQKMHELQNYFIAYIDYKKDKHSFNDWMNAQIKKMEAEILAKNQAKAPEPKGEVSEKV